MKGVKLTLTIEQAEAVSAALDFYTRICIGQIEEVVALAQHGVLVPHSNLVKYRTRAAPQTIEAMQSIVLLLKEQLGFPHHGSFGIGHDHVDVSAKRAWETKKALDKTLANLRDPNPSFKGVNYDGIVVRYTDDPEPLAAVVEPKAECEDADDFKP